MKSEEKAVFFPQLCSVWLEINPSKAQYFRVGTFAILMLNYRICLTAISCVGCLSWLTVGCQQPEYSECREIIAIANQVSQQAQKISKTSVEPQIEAENWLEVADKMKLAATKIAALSIEDTQMLRYQASLVNVFQVYAESTDEAVKARKSRDRTALRAARDKANSVGTSTQDLMTQINSYCESD